MSVQDFVRIKDRMEEEIRNGLPISQPAIKNFGKHNTEWYQKKNQ